MQALATLTQLNPAQQREMEKQHPSSACTVRGGRASEASLGPSAHSCTAAAAALPGCLQLGDPWAPGNFLPVSAHHILFSLHHVRILGCVRPTLPHRQQRCFRRRIWGRQLQGRPSLVPRTGHSPRSALIQPCLSPEPDQEPTSTTAASLLLHSPCTDPSQQCSRASTGSATSTRTEHRADAGRAAPTCRLPPAALTVLGLRRCWACCCLASATAGLQGWLEETCQPHGTASPGATLGQEAKQIPQQQQILQAASPQQHPQCSRHRAFLHRFGFGDCHPSCLCSHTQLPQRQEGEGLEQDAPQPHRVMCILTATTGSGAPPVPAWHRCGAMPHEVDGPQHLEAQAWAVWWCAGKEGGEAARTLLLSPRATWSWSHVCWEAGDPMASRKEGVKCLPALAATEGQRKAWKLEAQSSLTVPMLRRCRGRQEQAEAWLVLVPAGCRQGGRRTPAGWSRGRRLCQGSSSSGAHAPAPANPHYPPCAAPALLPGSCCQRLKAA